jgi:wyosine [tRNA(Phe)-imidazoG37] synthetase (radical SAM superfamily)
VTDDHFRYVFGPVVSRRLGRSLGVDVVPFKTCTYDCIYCQLGRTTHRTIERREYVPLEAALDELRRKCAAGLAADHITIAGSGEPTLYTRLGDLIAGIKATTSVPVAVLTNGSLLWDREVQDALLRADVVIPSLDAGDAAMFDRVNRPCPGIPFDKMVEGLVAFRDRYTGQIWLEVFLLKGITGTDAEVRKLIPHIRAIRPDRVQLNSLARPASGTDLEPPCYADMERFARILDEHAEVVAQYEPTAPGPSGSAAPADVLAVVRRHPCTIEDIAIGLGITRENAANHVATLIQRDAIRTEFRDGVAFYLARNA